LVIPEDFGDWMNDSAYPDLLTFESDIAQTSSLIVIALECPGAIAELGSFSVNTHLNKKLIVFLNTEHYDSNSFIKLGPLRQLPEENVYAYPYDYTRVKDTIEEYLSSIRESINERLDGIGNSVRFDIENVGHIAFLIYQLAKKFGAVKVGELKKYLEALNVNCSTSSIKRLVFLLVKLDFVKNVRRGNSSFICAIKEENKIKFGTVGRNNDDTLFRISLSKYYSQINDNIRLKVMRDMLGGEQL
jgi:hypothetical protein